ncbi:MAG: hypothetical protein HOP17_14195, partial [Acidobacteria bacterium]|nr:hypothetical protein [Acidobacteriota bacterium]
MADRAGQIEITDGVALRHRMRRRKIIIMKNFVLVPLLLLIFAAVAAAQTRRPSSASRPFVVKTKQQVADMMKMLEKKPGNTNEDIVAAAGMQTRVA